MVDAKPQPPTPGAVPGTPPAGFAGERSKIKLFMERTPSIGALKSKFLTVLGNSNELLNGISNKLTLSSSSSDSDYCDDDEDIPKFDESIDYTKIDFEGRRVKARRAHEEIISGRYRQPNLAPRPRLEPSRGRHAASKLAGPLRSSSGSSSSSSSSEDSSSLSLPEHMVNRSHEVSSTTRSDSIESRHSGGYERARAIAGARRSEMDMQRDSQRIGETVESLTPHIDVQPPTEGGGGGAGAGGAGSAGRQQWAGGSNSMRLPSRSRASNSSTLTSLRDEPDQLLASPSMESTDWRHFIRSESQNSVPSWASSISLDCRAGEEPVKEFMKHFTALLFGGSPGTVDLELKSEFGVLLRLEIGRLWFTRFLTEQRHKSKRLDSLTFGSLAQYFALALFECSECEDYAPAAVLMNLCFLFYHEVEVPGCDPYREYLFSSLRQQPIWQQARFWNAIFHDALQAEREHRGQSQMRRQQRRQQKQQQRQVASGGGVGGVGAGTVAAEAPPPKAHRKQGGDSSSSSSHQAVQSAAPASTGSVPANRRQSKTSITPQQSARDQEDIAFRQLGALTCNMHSLGTSQELCLDFLKKNVVALNLSKDKAKLIRDNIYRMYHETQLWGARHT